MGKRPQNAMRASEKNNLGNHVPALQTWLISNHAWLLVACFVVVLPFGTLFELPLACMAIIGLRRMWQAPGNTLRQPAVRLLLLLFACIWLPMLLSLPDAVNFKRSLSTVMAFLRYPLASIFIIQALQTEAARHRLIVTITVILGLWCVDGLIQALTGENLLGNPMNGDRLTGIFYPNLKLGHVMAVFSPVFLEGLRLVAWKIRWVWILILPYLTIILFSGSRVAWIMTAVSLISFAVYLYLLRGEWHWRRMVNYSAIGMTVLAILISQHAALNQRVKLTATLLSGNYEQANQATSIRLPIWETATRMAAAHWINGVGPRGFRYEYPKLAKKNDYFLALNPKQGPTHPHQITLEVAAETGILGLTGLVLFWALLARSVRKMALSQRLSAAPWLIMTGIALFPLNSGHAIYASFWSSITWWAIALFCAPLDARSRSAN